MREWTKQAVHRVFRSAGYEITRVQRPVIWGSEVIQGSFPPYERLFQVGRREDYFIQDGYQARAEYRYYNDTTNGDQWQNEVYCYAREIADRAGLLSVCDVGCGSGYKLIKYFGDRTTLGLDVEETVSVLKRRYPDREWVVSDFQSPLSPTPDLVICSDVIEHLLIPDSLLQYLHSIGFKFLVLSTPDRNLIRLGSHAGPPVNKAHIREWTMPELHAYVGEYFRIVEHFISNAAQATQCILAVPR